MIYTYNSYTIQTIKVMLTIQYIHHILYYIILTIFSCTLVIIFLTDGRGTIFNGSICPATYIDGILRITNIIDLEVRFMTLFEGCGFVEDEEEREGREGSSGTVLVVVEVVSVV